MTCNEVHRLLADLLGEELDERTHRLVQEHLAGCTACGAEVAALRAVLGGVRDLPSITAEQAAACTRGLVVHGKGVRARRMLAAGVRYAAVLGLGVFVGLGLRGRADRAGSGIVPPAAGPARPATASDPNPAWLEAARELASAGSTGLGGQLALIAKVRRPH